MKKYLVSIVVPIYNKEHEIKRLIKSIKIEQLKNEVELILVDDCSTDNTVNIIRTYLKNNIKLIQLKKNSGVHNARNTGIKNAQGDWIIFLDGDDFFIRNKIFFVINEIKNKTDKYDVIFFPYITNYKERTGLIKNGDFKSEEYISAYTDDNRYIFRQEKDCLYCIKKYIIKKYNIFWKFTNLDYIFRNTVVRYSKKNIFIDYPVAIYVKNSKNSLTSNRKQLTNKLNLSNIKLEFQIKFLEDFKSYFKLHKGGERYIKIMFYDFKYSKYRFLYLYKIFKVTKSINPFLFIRFLLISFLPIRTIAILKNLYL